MGSQSDTIPILEKAVSVMNAAAAGNLSGSVQAISARLGMPTTTCFRILKTLASANWLAPTETGYAVSMGMLPLLKPLMQCEHLVRSLGPAIEALTASTRLSAKLSVLQGREQVSVFRAESPEPMAVVGRVGSRFACIVGSSGAALMSRCSQVELDAAIEATPEEERLKQRPEDFLKRVAQCRKHGYCELLGPAVKGINTLSVPLVTKDEVVAAITLIGLQSDFEPERLPALRKETRSVAKACEQKLSLLPASS